MSKKLFVSLLFLCALSVGAQNIEPLNSRDMGGMSGFGDDEENRNFNPHNNDTTKQKKEIPKGIHVWTVSRFGDISEAEVDTMPHLYPQSTLGMGRYGEYNTTGNNFTPRLSRIFIDRETVTNFPFTDGYSQALRKPTDWHFTNTLSPITNLAYDNCGDKTNGEDHLDARFAVNAGQRTGIGFDLDYLYARGFFQNQSASHFGATIYGSYLGDQYQLHALFSTHHQKVAENGGITDDTYVTHPEHVSESFSDGEIPTVLASNWNRNHSQRLFLTHRYALGFYRKVRMTDEEIEARRFAQESAEAKERLRKGKKDGEENELGSMKDKKDKQPMGRPDNAKIMGAEPAPQRTDSLAADTTRIRVTDKAMSDSLLAQQAAKDSLENLMKSEFVPVTSFIHTLDIENNQHTYLAYATPADYYLNTYYERGPSWGGDSIKDKTTHLNITNTFAIALLEGFNKYVPMGLKVFASHELCRYRMPYLNDDGTAYLGSHNEHNISLGGQLIRSQGHTLHYDLSAETWLVGADAGQLSLDGSADLNFPLFGDTVRLAAHASFQRMNPTFLQANHHSKHLWWDLEPGMETRTTLEGIFSYEKTATTLRVAIQEIQNYTYLGMSYALDGTNRKEFTAALMQHAGNLNVLTAQLEQPLKFGPLHWDNRLTFQSSSNSDILPLPTLNVFTNLYLEFMVARVLRVELGGSATWFTSYYAPDYVPQLSQFAVQQNPDTRTKLGNFPFVDVYANLHLKHARFFILMNNATGTSFNRLPFLTPHYPMNRSTLHIGISWNFFN